MQKLKKWVFNIIEVSKDRNILSNIYDIILFFCIAVSTFCVIGELIGFPEAWGPTIKGIEYGITIFFIAEYLLKIWVAEFTYPELSRWKARWEFIISFESLIDLLSIFAVFLNAIPTEFAAVKLLKTIKLARLFKLSEVFENKQSTFHKLDKLKHRIYNIICKDENHDILSKIYDIFSIILIVSSVVVLIVDTFALSDAVRNALHIYEYVVASIFVLEYLLRIWTAPIEYPDVREDKARMKYIFSFMAIIDLLSILPVFLTQLDATLAIVKILKLFKILRLVKMSRYLSGINNFAIAVASKKKQIAFSMSTVALLMILCSVFIYAFEHTAQPDVFENAFSGIVYSFITLIGENDNSMEPITNLGKIFSAIMSLLGVCIFAVPITIVTDEFMKSSKGHEEKETSQTNTGNNILNLENLSPENQEMLKMLYEKMSEAKED